MRLVARLVGLSLVAVLAFALAVPPVTLAAFTDRATAASPDALATAGTLATPAAPTVGAGLGGTVAVGWQQTSATSGAGAVPATGYQVFRHTTATGTAAGTQVCPATAGATLPADARGCTVPGTLTGGTFYSVVARFATNWRRESTRTQLAADLAGPGITHAGPTDGVVSGSASAFRNYLEPLCPGGGVACGTATDPSAPVTVQYALTRRATGAPLSAGSCWAGTAWEAAPVLGGCGDRPATSSGTGWRVPGSSTAAYTGNGYTFTLRIVATDGAGNATTSQITYSY